MLTFDPLIFNSGFKTSFCSGMFEPFISSLGFVSSFCCDKFIFILASLLIDLILEA